MRNSVQLATKLNRKISSILTKPKVQTQDANEHLSSQRKNSPEIEERIDFKQQHKLFLFPCSPRPDFRLFVGLAANKIQFFFFLHNLARTVELSAIQSSPPFLGIHDLVPSKVCLQIQQPMRRPTSLQLLTKCSPNLYSIVWK